MKRSKRTPLLHLIQSLVFWARHEVIIQGQPRTPPHSPSKSDVWCIGMLLPCDSL